MGRHAANRRVVASAAVLAAGVGTLLAAGTGLASAAPVPNAEPPAPNVSASDGEETAESTQDTDAGLLTGGDIAGLGSLDRFPGMGLGQTPEESSETTTYEPSSEEPSTSEAGSSGVPIM